MYSEEAFRFFFMNMPQPVIVVEQEMDQLYYKECNMAARQFFDKMKKKPINKEENMLFYELCQKAIVMKEPIQYQYIQLFQPGRYAHEVTFTPIFNEATNPSHVLVMAQEIHYKKTEEESTRLLDAFLDNTVDAILIADCDEKVLTVNQSFETLFQWRKEEILGKSLQHMNIMSEKAAKENLEVIKKLKSGKIVPPYETVRYTKNGECVCVSVSCSPIYNHQNQIAAYSVIYRDITPQKEAEVQLAYMVKELENIKYALDESASVMIIDEEGTITYVNDMYLRSSNYKKEDLLGQYYRDVGLHHNYSELLETIKSGEVWRGELEMWTKHNQSYWVSKTIVPLKDIEGKVTHYVSIHNDITEQKALENKLHFEANHDSLTGLPNRTMLLNELNQMIDEVQRKNQELFALLFLDCDNFKQINDEYGHHIGDEFLKAYTKRLKSCVRQGDRIYRLGGDEFIIILNVKKGREIEQIARRIHASLQQTWHVRGYCLRTTTTIGVSIYPEDGDSATLLLQNADDALYKGKRDGKNNYILYQT